MEVKEVNISSFPIMTVLVVPTFFEITALLHHLKAHFFLSSEHRYNDLIIFIAHNMMSMSITESRKS